MNYFVWQRNAQVAIAGNRRVLSADEAPTMMQANDLCRQLDRLVSEQPEQLAAAAEAAREQGFEQGLAAGREAARAETAQALTAMSQQLAQLREQMNADVAALAIAATRKLIGEFSPADQLAALASAAASQVMQQSQSSAALSLHVHPDQADAVRNELREMTAGDALTNLQVVADDECARDDCVLNSELGTIDASLSVQLEQIARAWGAGISNDSGSA